VNDRRDTQIEQNVQRKYDRNHQRSALEAVTSRTYRFSMSALTAMRRVHKNTVSARKTRGAVGFARSC
jgi:hypothetical protein